MISNGNTNYLIVKKNTQSVQYINEIVLLTNKYKMWIKNNRNLTKQLLNYYIVNLNEP